MESNEIKFRNYCIVVLGNVNNVVVEIEEISEIKPNTIDHGGLMIATFISIMQPKELKWHFMNNNRNFLISDLLANTFSPFRSAMYEYHRLGLDLMQEDLVKGKEGVAKSIQTLLEIQKVRPNSLLMRTFFDAKDDEVVSVFSGGPKMDVTKLVETLNRISPLNSQKWNKIR